jgi:predicted nucleic acid-binding protein
LNLYLDTSALLKQYVAENGSQQMRALLSLAELWAASVLTSVEVTAALSKSVCMKVITGQDASQALRAFRRGWDDFVQIETTAVVLESASELAWQYGLRAYDAVHLASARFWQESLQEQVVMATFDHQLWLAAQQERLQLYPQTWPMV